LSQKLLLAPSSQNPCYIRLPKELENEFGKSQAVQKEKERLLSPLSLIASLREMDLIFFLLHGNEKRAEKGQFKRHSAKAAANEFQRARL